MSGLLEVNRECIAGGIVQAVVRSPRASIHTDKITPHCNKESHINVFLPVQRLALEIQSQGQTILENTWSMNAYIAKQHCSSHSSGLY